MTRGWMAAVALVATLAAPEMAAAEPDDRPIAASVQRLVTSGAAGPLADLGEPKRDGAALRMRQRRARQRDQFNRIYDPSS